MTDPTRLKYTAEHEWVALEGDIATIGITEYAAERLGDVVFADLPDAGTAVTAGQVCGEIESTKSVGELYAPLDGEVVESNPAIEADPSTINVDPYGAGWLVKLRIDPDTTGDLLDRDAYLRLIGEEA